MKVENQNKVLIIGDSSRAALSVIRSLGKNRINCDLLVFNKESICLYSKYIKNRYFIKNFFETNTQWKKLLKKTIEKNKYTLIIPLADASIIPLFKNLRYFKNLVNIAIPNERGIEYTFNKAKTYEMAKKNDVPIPKTKIIYSVSDLKENLYILHKWNFPLFIKPIKSYIERDHKRIIVPHFIIERMVDLNKKIQKYVSFAPIIVQEYIYGNIIGQEFIVKSGQIINAFQHLRLHQSLEGGGSSFRRSMIINKKILWN